MWQKMQTERNPEKACTAAGVVSAVGEELCIRTELEHRSPRLVVPFGMAVCPPEGEKVIMLSGENVCLGNINAGQGLQPGELRLYSAGGAEIWLRADGTVVINGQTFAPKEA